MNESMHKHACDHGACEDEREGLARSKQCDGRAWADPSQSPTHTEYRRASDQVPVDRAVGWNMQRRGKQGLFAGTHPSVGRGGGDQRANHDQRQGRVPSASDVEEGKHARRVGHVGNEQSESE